jgi:hypothetical protein
VKVKVMIEGLVELEPLKMKMLLVLLFVKDHKQDKTITKIPSSFLFPVVVVVVVVVMVVDRNR